jgi:crossover junction endodeoxyribonuclease RusA
MIKLFFPLPPVELSPNARVHWAKKAKAVQAYKEVVHYLAVDAMNEQRWRRLEKAIIYLTFCYTLRRKRDYDNCLSSVKPLLDGLVSAGLLHDDDTAHLRIGGIEIAEKQKAEGVAVTLLECVPNQEIKIKPEVAQFVMNSCGQVNNCEMCPLREDCIRLFSKQIDRHA